MEKIFLFENENFIAVQKPAGILSVPGRNADGKKTLAEFLQYPEKLYPVHRLDYEVSGVLLLAKNKDAHVIANSWFEKRMIHKTYYAKCENLSGEDPQRFEGEWKSHLMRGKKRAYEIPFEKNVVLAKKNLAITFAKILKNDVRFPIWRLNPLTGRSHQLRYELYKRKMPVLGDVLYGATLGLINENVKFGPNQQSIALFAHKLDFSDCAEATHLGLPQCIEMKVGCFELF